MPYPAGTPTSSAIPVAAPVTIRLLAKYFAKRFDWNTAV